MKKLLAVLLVAIMLFTFAGCYDTSTLEELNDILNEEGDSLFTEKEDFELPSATTPDEEVSRIPSNSGFTKGSIVDGVYTNNWADLKFEISGNWVEGEQSSYDSYESTANTYCGLVAQDKSADFKQLDIAFEKLTGLNTVMTEDGYIDNLMSLFEDQYGKSGFDVEIGDVSTRIVANKTYKTFTMGLQDNSFVQQVCVRKLGNYIIFINVTAKDSVASNSVLNSIEAVN